MKRLNFRRIACSKTIRLCFRIFKKGICRLFAVTTVFIAVTTVFMVPEVRFYPL
ncbi:MAG: hypothetical protein J6K31_07745 [Parabacteroides sp.]|nr:hypothetical protein [Parabacteroides sp.]